MTTLQSTGRPAPETPFEPGRTGLSGRLRDAHGLSLPARLLVAAVVLAVGWVSVGGASSSDLFMLTTIVVWALIATSLNIVVGFVGQLALSSGFFFALGAYVGVLGTGRWEWPGWLSLLVALGGSAVLAGLLGMVIFRTRALYFALITTGVSLVAYELSFAWSSVTGGAAGISTAGPVEEGGISRPFDLGVVAIEEPEAYFRLGLVALVLLVLGLTVVLRRREGASWRAVREDDALAASVGIDVARRKRIAYIVSSTLIGGVGVYYGHWAGFITPDSFTFADAAFAPLAMVVIGGSGTLLGPILGATVVAGFPEVFRDLRDYSILLYGAILLAAMMIAPRGIVGLAKDGVRGLAGRRAARGERRATTANGDERRD
ncbi:branched-chain amino acid ABC transporter permease [Nocardioides campestrisoli]|uniref:branched-chain amino acid ABC transporter permease n=1 Tax=Nocardioides campestrisoli TaxID=2736757 RepID=UPI00163D7612|nr:branched-chain amino acid ABC transporter permease [Nocardioides campestrisoli]